MSMQYATSSQAARSTDLPWSEGTATLEDALHARPVGQDVLDGDRRRPLLSPPGPWADAHGPSLCITLDRGAFVAKGM